jgi:hypothetical protein
MATYEWVDGNGNYTDASNWKKVDTFNPVGPPAGPPGSSDTAEIDTSNPASVLDARSLAFQSGGS